MQSAKFNVSPTVRGQFLGGKRHVIGNSFEFAPRKTRGFPKKFNCCFNAHCHDLNISRALWKGLHASSWEGTSWCSEDSLFMFQPEIASGIWTYGKLLFMDLPIKHGDVPWLCLFTRGYVQKSKDTVTQFPGTSWINGSVRSRWWLFGCASRAENNVIGDRSWM